MFLYEIYKYLTNFGRSRGRLSCFPIHIFTSNFHIFFFLDNNGIAAITNNINNTSKTPCALKAPLVVCVCGPPCRGKSLYSHRIARHLTWKGENAKVFSVGTNTTIDTLIEITDWFDKGNNVAVSLIIQFNQFIHFFAH